MTVLPGFVRPHSNIKYDQSIVPQIQIIFFEWEYKLNHIEKLINFAARLLMGKSPTQLIVH